MVEDEDILAGTPFLDFKSRILPFDSFTDKNAGRSDHYCDKNRAIRSDGKFL
jgi:hypothetical protein